MYFSKKSTVALAVAATFAGGALTTAYAGTASATYNTYATEAIKSGIGLGTINSPSIAYQPDTVIASGTTFTVYIKLNGGATWNSPTSTSYSATYGSGSSQESVSSSSAFSVSQNGKVLAVTFSNSNSHNKGATFNMSTVSGALDLKNASSLKTSGASITANFAFANNAASSPANYPSSPQYTAKGTIAEAKQAVKIHFVNSSNYKGAPSQSNIPTTSNENTKIDVTTKPPLSGLTTSKLTTSDKVDLGAVYLTNSPGTELDGSGNAYTVSNIQDIKATISGTFLTNGQEKWGLYNNANCTSLEGSSTVTPSQKSTVSLKLSGQAAAQSPTFGCITTTTSNISNVAQLPTTQPKVQTIKLLDSHSNVVDTASSKPLYKLGTNGADILMENYVPAAAKPYQTYVRVANNGDVKAPVRVTVHGANGNVLGSGTLATLGQNVSKTFSASQVEKAAGVSLTKQQRPQIELTSPTTQLDAQSYLKDGNGGFTNMTTNKTSSDNYKTRHNPK